ncbi:T9SS type A sorting domain-containing protein [Flammeovirga sp. SubArs3]|uniref:fibronectin type III domain-containing protein n=1 Tax=Flammeovirga sp. SubArs3 TaxID=2995316 RepID=UPI00248BC719|nr:T9SS type A sorting domain-containing protein [Flammeovirga sp. SubArs3]
MKRNVLLLFLSCLSISSLFAKDIYVSNSGNNSNDGLTSNTAVATLNTAYTLAENGDVIYLNGTITHAQAFSVEKNITIIGQNNATLDGGSATKFFNYTNIQDGAYLIVKNVTFTNGNGMFNTTQETGGAIWVSGSGEVTFQKCNFTNNSTVHDGGAIAAEIEGTLNLLSCKITNNTTFVDDALGNGGAIVAGIGGNTVNLNIYETLVQDNKSNRQGGAMYIYGAVFTHIRNSTFYGNRSSTQGGTINVVSNSEASTRFDNVTMTFNGNANSVKNCGGLRSSNANHEFIINNSIIHGNLSKVQNDGTGDPSDVNFVEYKSIEINSSIIGNFVSGLTEDIVNDGRVLFGNEETRPVIELLPIDDNGIVSFPDHSVAANYGDPSIVKADNDHPYLVDQLGMIRSKLSGSIDVGAYQRNGRVAVEDLIQDETAPEQPENVNFTEILDTALELEWDEAIDDVATEYYTIAINDEDPVITNEMSMRYTELDMDTEYKFTIVAYDFSGKSSEPLEFYQFTDKPIVPLIPYNLAAVEVSGNSATITWEVERHKGLIYELDVYGRWYETEDLSFELTDLIPNKEYIVVIRTRTKESNQLSEYSELFSFTTGDEVLSLGNHAIQLNAFPNPTSHTMNFEVNASQSEYVVYDLTGTVVAKSEVFGNTFELSLPQGLYIIQITSGEHSISKKIIFD